MDKKEAINRLKQALYEIPHLRQLKYDNQEFKLWCNRIGIIRREAPYLEGISQLYAIRQDPYILGGMQEGIYQEKYLRNLTNYETILKLIMQNYELLENEKEPKATAELPLYLFDKMQFHPRVVEASRPCFTTVHYREAILNAFISLIDYIKEITGLDLDGDDLMNNVFSFNYDREQRKITKYPTISINELKNKTDRDEQYGFMFLCKGAAAFIRNPKAHKLISQTEPLYTLEYLAFASLLFRQLDKRR